MKKLIPILLTLFCMSQFVHAQTPWAEPVERPGIGYVFLHNNNPVNNLIWEEAEPFVNGYSRVLKSGKFGFVNDHGEPVGQVIYDGARNYSQRLVAVEKDGRWGFMDENGRLAIPIIYEIAFDFTDSITAVYINKQWQLINQSGRTIHVPAIDVCYGFSNGIAKIEAGGKKGTMNMAAVINMTTESVATTVSRQNPNPIANATSQCPDNIDFENGNLNNWSCFTGRVDSIGNTNVITVTPSAPVPNRHRIINRTIPSAIDPFGLFPTNPPDGSNFAVRLGNTNIGAQSERIQYKIRVPANDSNFSIKYDYAVVFQDPGHTAWTQPRFTARLFDSAANAYVNCASFEYIATSNLPGFAQSPVDTSVIFKPWSSVFISLRAYAGKTMYLEFTTADCVRRGHWGYAYVDVESTCGQSVTMEYDCNFPNITSLDAPPGFQTYNWWNQGFTTMLATGQHVVLNPGPPSNTTLWVEMIPYNDFGCRDTIPVRITGGFTPAFDATDTVGVCTPFSITFFNRSLPSTSVRWDFGDGSTGTGDTVTHIYTNPGTYIVTQTVTLPGGCTGTTQDTVQIFQPSASFDYSGGNFCNSRVVRFDAVVSHADSLHWDFGDGTSLSTTQTTVFHTYLNAGTYLPVLTISSVRGCSINYPGAEPIRIEVLDPGFFFREERTCTSTTVHFTDSSHSQFGISTYSWDFGDGGTATGANPSHTYMSSGTYNVQLIITGNTRCRDTIVLPVNVTIYNAPVALVSGPIQACPGIALTFNSTINSIDAIQSLSWSTSDGGSGNGNDYTHTFSNAGTYNIQLIATTVNGCSDTISQPVLIHPTPVIDIPANQQVCAGNMTTAVVLNSSIPGSTIAWTNDFPAIGLPSAGTNNLPAFTGVNNTGAAIIANITVLATSPNGCSADPVQFNITVNPIVQPFVPANQEVCNGAPTTAVILNSLTSAVSSSGTTWTNSHPTIGLAPSGTGNIPSFIALNNSDTVVTATITLTSTSNGCTAAPVHFTITINPTPVMDAPPAQEICNAATSSIVHFTGSNIANQYQWVNNTPAIGLTASGLGDIPAFTGINTTSAVLTATITVNPSLNGCTGSPRDFNITVNPTPDMAQPADQSVCNGSATSAISFTSNVTGATYNWTNSQPSIGLPTTGTGEIPSFNPVNNDVISTTATITVTPMINSCPGAPKDFSITVLPRPAVIQPLNQVICNGTMADGVVLAGPVAGTSYTWTNDNPSIGLAASGTGNITSFAGINSGNTPVVANITVTATANGCTGNTRTFSITVDPTPAMSQPPNHIVCSGTTIPGVNFTGTVAGTSFYWINSNANIGLAQNGNGNIPSFVATNTNNYPITAIVSVTGTANACNSVGTVFTIRVNPSPAIYPLFDQAVCNTVMTDTIELTGPVFGTTYSWTNDHPAIGLAANGTGHIPAFIASNNGSTSVIANINVTANVSTGCNTASQSFKITVHPTPDVNGNTDQTICRGGSLHLEASGAYEYIWEPPTGLSCFDCATPVASPLDSVMYVVEGISRYGCKAFDSVKVNVIQPFDMIVAPGDTICQGRAINLHAERAMRYIWSPSTGLNATDIANPVASPDSSTTYQVIGYDDHHCFADTASVRVTVGPNPQLQIGPDVTASAGSSVIFSPVTQNGPIVSWQWSPAVNLSCSDCPSPTATVANNTSYTLTIRNSFGCVVADTVTIITFCKNSQVFVPNAFTPDGDGLNDILMVRGTGVTVKSFRVFNRWGNLIFEKQGFSPNDPRFGWDGKVRGVLAQPDVYVYTAEVTCDNGVVYTYKGNTTILK